MKRKKAFCLSLTLLLLITLLPVPASAAHYYYETNGNKIVDPITFTANNQFTASSRSHMSQAVAKWNSAAGTTLMSMSSSTHSSTSGYPSRDGKPYVYRINVGSGYVAQCRSYRNLFGYLYEADININVYYKYANSAQPGCYDLYSVFLHETGHAAGLADLESPSYPVMYGYSSTNTTKRNLTTDDIAGILSIY